MDVTIENQDKNEGQITPQELAFFEKLLNDTLDDLICQASWAVSEMSREQPKEIELLDTAMTSINQGLNLRLQTRTSRLIKKIRSALQRIEEGTYGYCEFCGEPISSRRLAARPVTSKCLECKEAEERLEALLS